MFYFISIFTLFVSYISSIKLADKINLDRQLINFFFLIKFLYLLTTIYYISFDLLGTDAKSYYLNSNKFDPKIFWIGDNLLYGLNYFFKEYFYLDFQSVNVLTFFLVLWSTLLLLNIIGTIKNKFLKILLYILLLLPSLNFWTSGLSKDMLCYCALSFFVFSMFKKDYYLIILSIFCIFLIRPYVSFFILLSFCFVGFIYIVKKIFFSKKK